MLNAITIITNSKQQYQNQSRNHLQEPHRQEPVNESVVGECSISNNILGHLQEPASVLVDMQKWDEAEVILKELLNYPDCKSYAEGELQYIENTKNINNKYT